MSAIINDFMDNLTRQSIG